MPGPYFVRSTNGASGDGLSWATAKQKLSEVAAIAAAGDVVYVSKSHAEANTTGVVTMIWAGTPANPIRILCVDDTGDPVTPTTLAETATLTTSGTNSLTMRGSIYVYGMTFACGSGNNYLQMYFNMGGGAVHAQRYEKCDFSVVDTHPSSFMQFGSITGGEGGSTQLLSCRMKFASTGGYAILGSKVHIVNFSFMAGTALNAAGMFSGGAGAHTANILIEGSDFSNMASTLLLFQAFAARNADVIIRNVKVPAGWTGAFVAGAAGARMINMNTRIDAYNYDSGTKNYQQWTELFHGQIKHETTIVKTGGASDGTTTKSLALQTNTNPSEAVAGLASPYMEDWIDTVGVAKTVTVDILHDSATALLDSEIWLEVEYLGSAASPISSKVSSKRVNFFAVPAAAPASAATWTTTGLVNPNKQKLSVTFTPQMKGAFLARVIVGKPSKLVYVDPVAQVS